MSLKIEQLLESLVEAIREKRRFGPRFPTPYDLSRILWNNEFKRIEFDLLDEGKIRKFDLYLDEVQEHGDTWVDTSEDKEVIEDNVESVADLAELP